MDVKWGSNPAMLVRPDRFGRDRVELVSYFKEAPTAVLHSPDVLMMPLSKDQAKKLGAALIRVANSV